jgi:hypothetical protein
MSKSFNKRVPTTVNNNSVKKFCKVCHDAGKSESEYTSHFVRSSTASDGVIVCPTLLATNCRYCGKNGHTIKFCSELKEKKKAEERGAKRASMQEKNNNNEKRVEEKKTLNGFAILDEEEDEQEEDEQEEVMLINEVKKNNVFSYANMAAKPAVAAVPPPAKIIINKPVAVTSHSVMVSDYYEDDNESFGSSVNQFYRIQHVTDSYLDTAEEEQYEDDEEEYNYPIGKPAPWATNYKPKVSSW